MFAQFKLKNKCFIFALLLLIINVSDAQNRCTKWKYGPQESSYMPRLVEYCCPGYGGFNTTECLPRCDLGCPENSHCKYPNICECNQGYEKNETYMIFGTEAIKSCESHGGGKTTVATLAIYSLIFLGIFAVIFFVLCMMAKSERIDHMEMNG